MILKICDTPQSMVVMNVIVRVIEVIRIVVPIILLFSLALIFTKASMSGNQDAIEKIKKKAVPVISIAFAIFIVPTIVNLIIEITMPGNGYSECLVYISENKIDELYEDKAEYWVLKTEETLDINDYNTALGYLPYVKNEEKKEYFEIELQKMKVLIDEFRKSEEGLTSGLGMDIVPKEELIEACRWIMDDDKVNIRLSTCVEEEYKYKDPERELPGGATEQSNGQWRAKKTIPLSEYQMGVFFGEEHVTAPAESRNAFMLIYKTELIHNTVHYAIKAGRDPLAGEEIYFRAGSCAQNYRESQRRSKYDSGKYKKEIDETVENIKYLVIADDAGDEMGQTTNVIYHSYTGIEQQIEQAGRDGKEFVEIIENVIKSGNDDSYRYKNARVYDCRNIETGNIGISKIEVNNDTIYMGDGRTFAYKKISKKLNLDETKEFVIARYKTTYDKYFDNQINKAIEKVSNNKKDTVVLNYGINDVDKYEEYCDGYIKLAKQMDNNDEMFIVSVNPVNDETSARVKNTDVERFNNYMQNTCINRLKEVNSNVDYCDINNALPLERWLGYHYMQDDGIHYNNPGYKYIYSTIKKCIVKQ